MMFAAPPAVLASGLPAPFGVITLSRHFWHTAPPHTAPPSFGSLGQVISRRVSFPAPVALIHGMSRTVHGACRMSHFLLSGEA
jgi:hypothetical protein